MEDKVKTAKELCEEITSNRLKSIIDTIKSYGGIFVCGDVVCRKSDAPIDILMDYSMVAGYSREDYVYKAFSTPDWRILNKLKELGYTVIENKKEVILNKKIIKKTNWWSSPKEEKVPFKTVEITEILISACCEGEGNG